jgi:hypothetical protein
VPTRSTPHAILAAVALALPVGALGWLTAPSTGAPSDSQRDRQLGRELLDRIGARLDLDTPVYWLEARQSVLASRVTHTWAVVRALPPGEANHDIYLVAVRLSPEGRLLQAGASYNLTETRLVDDGGLTGNGKRIAWTVLGNEHVYRVEYADLTGEPLPANETWTPLAQVQQGITNWQELGLFRGIERRSFRLDPAASHATVELGDDWLRIDADGRLTQIPTAGPGEITGARHIQEERRVAARPGELVTWAVDRVRELPWFGSDRMQLVKALAYRALAWAAPILPHNDVTDFSQSDALNTPSEPSRSAPVVPVEGGAPARWPPASLPLAVSPAMPGEGNWRTPTGDPFVHPIAGLPMHVATTFLRPDPEQLEARVVIAAWDPRQIELNFMAGTSEPKSDTGETGSGLIPRKPEHISRLIGAFNSGFQSTHGHWGAMIDRKVFLMPKPFAATVARLDDGSVGFGTWPLDTSIPSNIESFRQNLTPLVGDGRINPYNRTWWGGVPYGWTDDTLTVRAGLCLTKEGLLAYFYGSRVDHLLLAKAMIAARCDYGMHLDMNAGHTGFEFYNVAPAAALPPLPFSLDKNWQAEGEVTELPGYRFRGRRLFDTMQLMQFPRYINRGSRDFFYLTERHLVPGAAIPSPFDDDPSEGQWQLADRSGGGFPYAAATTSLRPDATRPESKVRVLQLDLKALGIALEPSDTTGAAASVLRLSLPALEPEGNAIALKAGRAVLIDDGDVSRSAAANASIVPLAADDGVAAASTAWGAIAGELLVYAEVVTARDPARDRALLESVLDALGCDARVFSAKPTLIALEGARDLAGHPIDSRAFGAAGRRVLSFVRQPWRAERRLFTDTPIVPPETWYYYQKLESR